LLAALLIVTALVGFFIFNPSAINECLGNGFAGSQNISGNKWKFVGDVVTIGVCWCQGSKLYKFLECLALAHKFSELLVCCLALV
jgi:hypothetical protein